MDALKPAWIIFFSIFISSQAWSVSESKLESKLNAISEFYESGQAGGFSMDKKMDLAFRYFIHPESKARLIILPGRTEAADKYDELVYDLYPLGYSIFLLDWPGQGRSGRFLASKDKGHIEDYNYYMESLLTFIEVIVDSKEMKEKNLGPMYALAHSMGANALSLYASNPAYQKRLDKIILSSPMLDIPTPGPQKLSWYLLRFLEWLGYGESYAPGHTPFSPNEKNYVTSSKLRYKKQIKWRVDHPEFNVGGATNSFARASIEATWRMRENAEMLIQPILLLQAKADKIVLTEGQDYVCQKAKACTKVEFPTAEHEILQENDQIRNKAIKEILKFLGDKQTWPPKDY